MIDQRLVKHLRTQFALDDRAAATQSAQIAVYYDDNDGTRATQQQIIDESK